MGFRNPLTSLSAEQITPGTLVPGVVAQRVLSAATGNRISVAQVGPTGALEFFAGLFGETPATVQAVSSGGAAGDQVLTINGGTNFVTEPAAGPPAVVLFCAQDAFGVWRGHIRLNADEVGPIEQATLVPINGWSTTNLYNPPMVYRDPFGWVEIQARVTGGAAGSVAFKLPEGFRPTRASPTEPMCFPVDNQGQVARALVYPDGRVVLTNAPAGAGTSVNVRFRR